MDSGKIHGWFSKDTWYISLTDSCLVNFDKCLGPIQLLCQSYIRNRQLLNFLPRALQLTCFFYMCKPNANAIIKSRLNAAVFKRAAEVFSEVGINHQYFKKLTSFRRAVHRNDHFSARCGHKRSFFAFFAQYRACMVRVFCRTT